MKVEETKPILPTQEVRRNSEQQVTSGHQRKSDDTIDGDEAATSLHQDEIEIAAFRGLSPKDLTENARVAMMTLIAEIGQLRQELSRGRKRIAYLSNLADHDDLSTALNRRAFLRELGHAQILAREYGALNTLLFITVENLGEINDEFGHAAGDSVVEHVAETLLRYIGKADVLGRLGGAEFALVLVGRDVDASREKAEWIEKLLCQHPYIEGERTISLQASVAVHPLAADEDAESALLAADRDRGD